MTPWFIGVIHNFKKKCLLLWKKKIQTHCSGKEGKTSRGWGDCGFSAAGSDLQPPLRRNCFICLFYCYLWSELHTSVGSRQHFLQLIWDKFTLGKYYNWFMTMTISVFVLGSNSWLSRGQTPHTSSKQELIMLVIMKIWYNRAVFALGWFRIAKSFSRAPHSTWIRDICIPVLPAGTCSCLSPAETL